jgi:chromosome segregation ATPase
MDKEVDRLTESQKTFRTDLNILEDRVMDVEMSAKGAYTMMAPLKDDVQELNDAVANLSNQLESVRVEDVAWYWSRISVLEKPNNPANKSLWLLVNQLSRRVEDQQDQIAALQAGMIGTKERVGTLEMSSAMIRSRVSIIEDAMEIDPPVTDLSAVVLIEILNTLWSLSGFANFFYPGPFQQAIGGEAC